MIVHFYVSSLQLEGREHDKQTLCMGKSINSKELSSKKGGLICGGTEFYTVSFNYFTTLGKASCYLKSYY